MIFRAQPEDLHLQTVDVEVDLVDVAGNEVSGAPHQGMEANGNDHVFEENYIHDVCIEASDSGALYAGQSWTVRGNVARNNRFENIRATEKTALGWPDAMLR